MKSNPKVQLHTLNRIKYKFVWDFQETLQKSLIDNKLSTFKKSKEATNVELCGHLILCEHDPVYTLGKSGSIENLLNTKQELEDSNIEFFKINRGGDITYHGPGQITGYLILDLDHYYHDVHKFVRDIELSIVNVLSQYNLKGVRLDGYTGVWLQDQDNDILYKKICAIGVHMSRWVSLHGFAFNIHPDLDYFSRIIPCGIVDVNKEVTSLERELGKEVRIPEIIPSLTTSFSKVFGFDII